MRETEATAKWCPMVRMIDDPEGPAGNMRWISEPVSFKQRTMGTCIASQCMMWRWTAHGRDMPRNTWEGYCGLAGRP